MKLINRIRAIRLTERQVLRIYLGMVVLLVGLWAADSSLAETLAADTADEALPIWWSSDEWTFDRHSPT